RRCSIRAPSGRCRTGRRSTAISRCRRASSPRRQRRSRKYPTAVQDDERNPYSAPKVPVADPLPVPVERPRVVTRAVRLLWISFLIGVAGAIDSFEAPPDAIAQMLAILFDVFWFGVAA